MKAISYFQKLFFRANSLYLGKILGCLELGVYRTNSIPLLGYVSKSDHKRKNDVKVIEMKKYEIRSLENSPHFKGLRGTV